VSTLDCGPKVAGARRPARSEIDDDELLEATGRSMWLEVEVDGYPPLRVRLTHIGPWGARAVVPPDSPWTPAVGEDLRNVRIDAPEFDRTFAHARVSGCEPGDGGTTIDVRIEPESGTGVLWALYDQTRSGAGSRAARPPKGWRPPKVPARGHYTEAARLERLDWISEQTGADTAAIRATSLDATTLTSNVENFVAGVEVPVGLAGPLWFNGEHVQGLVTAPFATTEGALVASATRGATALSRAGGVTTRVVRQRMTRAPVFVFAEAHAAATFGRWILDHLDDVRREVQNVSNWVNLIDVDPLQIGNQVHVRFLYETGDAAGQNMTTTCTWRACQWMRARMETLGLPVGRLLIDANVSGDKKANYMSFIAGRGIRVIAECFIDGQTLVDVLKVTPEEMEMGVSAFMAGTLQIGALGFDINIANTVAAIFTATGQDIACTHESSLGILTVRAQDGGLYAAMTLPALIVGTVGGGTALPQQRAYLELMGCAGTGKVRRLAEIVAGYALSLDLSTLAAVVSGQFADSHERLGRNRPVEWFTREDLTPALLEPIMARHFADDELTVTGVRDKSLALGSSIISELTAQKAMRKLVGFVPLEVDVERTAGGERITEVLDVVVKSKPLGDEVALMLAQLASRCGGAVSSEYARWQQYLGFNQTHRKELHLASGQDPALTRIMPRVFGTVQDPAREVYLLVTETLDDTCVLKDTADDVSGWELHHLETAVRDLALAHSVWLDRTDELVASDWMGPVPTATLATEMMPLWSALAYHGRDEFPEWFVDDDLKALLKVIEAIPRWWDELEAMPHTLIHNDFNPRNICLRPDDGATGLRLVAYDWELATVHVPQRDLAELLTFTLPPDADLATVDHLVEVHRSTLEAASGRDLDRAQWRRGYRLSLLDFMVQRLTMYVMAHTFRDYRFLERVVATTRALVTMERSR
jgi:hydroxymethylglutaryl-CoA reductase (NADPH)